MTYTLRFFTHQGSDEQLINETTFNSMPYIPHKGDLIIFEDDQYLVRRVATDYIDRNNQLFDVMLDLADYSKEWWE